MREKLKRLIYNNRFVTAFAEKRYFYQLSQLEPYVIDASLPLERFVFVIPSYNNERFCERNLSSCLDQEYPSFRVLYIDDASTDSTYNKVMQLTQHHPRGECVEVMRREVNRGALSNIYEAVHTLCGDEIVVLVDGDDWLAHPYVLSYLQKVYQEKILVTYGSYMTYPYFVRGYTKKTPSSFVSGKVSLRQLPWCFSHLRTFKASLFHRIAKEDLLDEKGEFAKVAWDLAIMLPLLEMARGAHRHLEQILYVYNQDNPLNDNKLYLEKQREMEMYFRKKACYAPVYPH